MGWNGSGTFNRSDGTRSGTQVWQDAKTAGVKIRADDHDTHDQDIADGLENTVALDGQTTTTTDNAILRYDSGNTKFEGVTISASQLVGRSAAGDTRGMSAATARQTIGVGSAAPTNNQFLYWASASSQYVQAAAATARSLIGLGTASPTNNQALFFSSSSSTYEQKSASTARSLLGVASASNTNGKWIKFSSASNAFVQVDNISNEGVVDATNGGSNNKSQFDFTGIASGAKRITVLLDKISLDGGTDDLLIQIGDTDGVETSGYQSVGSQATGSGHNFKTSTSGFIIYGALLNLNYYGAITLTLADPSNNTWVAEGSIGNDNSAFRHTVGGKSLSKELDRVRIKTTGTDSFDNGNLNVRVET